MGSVVFVAIPTATQSETYIAVETVELSTRAMVVQCTTSNRSDLQGGMKSEPESNTTVTAHGTTEKHFLVSTDGLLQNYFFELSFVNIRFR